MTVLKLTSSGKGVLVIDDDGNVFITSVNSILYLIKGFAKGGFITTNRLPFPVAPDRFKQSELYDPDGTFDGNAAKTVKTTTNDALSVKVRKEMDNKKKLEDKKVF